MSVPKAPLPAKLIVGVFTGDKEILAAVTQALVADFGELDLVSPWMPFGETTYYEKEMGPGLCRRLFSFETLIHQDDLAEIKLSTNRIEQTFLSGTGRVVNIDPGYMVPARFVLASGKDYAHKIHIGSGIYADLTLLYRKDTGFTTLPWTYPDYTRENVIAFLALVREKYMSDMKNR